MQRRIGTERDLRVIQKESAMVILKLLPFQSVGFVFMRDALDFSFDYMEPENSAQLLQDELEEQIEAGNFALALKQSEALAIHPLTNKPGRNTSVLLHPLNAEGRDIGLFIGVIQEEKQKVNQEVLTLLSIIPNTTALALENARLYFGHSKAQ